MPRKSKAQTQEEVVVAQPTPVVPTPAPEVPAKKPRRTKASAPVEEVPVVPAVVVEEVVVPEVPEVDAAESDESKKPSIHELVSQQLAAISERLETNLEDVDSFSTSQKLTKFLKSLLRDVQRVQKNQIKAANSLKKKRTVHRNSSNSGFSKPIRISSQLQKFMGLDAPNASRSDVTIHLCKYIKDHNLQVENNRKFFAPDAALSKLLGGNEHITYWMLQKKISEMGHFPKEN